MSIDDEFVELVKKTEEDEIEHISIQEWTK